MHLREIFPGLCFTDLEAVLLGRGNKFRLFQIIMVTCIYKLTVSLRMKRGNTKGKRKKGLILIRISIYLKVIN
jgi:hypothetical protein